MLENPKATISPTQLIIVEDFENFKHATSMVQH